MGRGAIRSITLLAAAGLLAATLANALSPNQPQLTDEEKLYGLSLIWKEVAYNFAFFDQVPDLDWDGAYREFMPQVLATTTTFDYYRVLQRFLSLHRDGHTNIYFPDDMEMGGWVDRPWILLREIQRRAIVSNVEPGLARLVPVGSEILEVDGLPAAEHLARNVFPYVEASSERMRWERGIVGSRSGGYGLLYGPPDSEARLRVRTPGGEVREVVALRDRSSRESEYEPPLPEVPVFEYRPMGGGIAYVALNTFGDRSVVEEFQALIPELQSADGLILDLRRNGGGSDSNGVAIMIPLTEDTIVGPAWRTRIHNAAFKAWGAAHEDEGPEGEYWSYYVGDAWEESAPGRLPPQPVEKIKAPIVALMGRTTASAAENFLVVLHSFPNVTLVGEPTAGTTGQPLHFQLPGGGSARVVVKRNTYPDGRDYMGIGVQPDILVEFTLEDLRQGRDPVLERALELLRDGVTGELETAR